MNTVDVLSREYPGDEAWRAYAKAVGSADDEIANVAGALIGEGVQEWLSSPVRGLGGQTPLDVIKTYSEGQNAIRTFLMRFP